MEMRRDVFQAISDPTRREIIDLLYGKKMNLNMIAENFDISRPAISKHIRILSECGLIVIKKTGRERFCEARFEKLREVNTWTEKYSRFWDGKIEDLKNFLEKEK